MASTRRVTFTEALGSPRNRNIADAQRQIEQLHLADHQIKQAERQLALTYG